MSEARLPWSLQENPRLSNWLDFSEAGVVRAFTAKVELGQGIVTAMTQIAAEELALPLSRIRVVSGDTRCCPNESYTAGSMSIEIGGTSLRMACAEARAAILREAAKILAADVARITVTDGKILLDGANSGLDYWKVAPTLDWSMPVTGAVPLSDAHRATILGKSVARLDLPAKVSGGGFIQDLELPQMVYAQVMRPPSIGARLKSLDESRISRLPGVVRVFRRDRKSVV